MLQFSLFRFGRQIGDQPLQDAEKLHLLTVLGLVNDLAPLDRGGIVRANVIQQMQGLGRAVDGIGQQVEAEKRQHRQH